MNKKTLITIIIIVLLLISLGVFVYLRSQETKKEATTKTEVPTQEREIKELFSQEMSYATLSEDADYFLYYSESDKGIFRQNIDGSSKRKLYSLNNVSNIIWSPQKNGAIVKINDSFDYLDLQRYKMTRLNQNVLSVNWAEEGKKIVYHYSDINENHDSFSIANPDGSGWRELYTISPGEYELIGYFEDKIIYLKTTNDFRQVIYSYNGSEIKILEDATSGYLSKLGYLVAINYEGNCYLINLNNNIQVTDLQIKTGPQKVALSPDNKFVLIASTQVNNQSYKVYRITLENLHKEEFTFLPEKNIEITKLMINRAGNKAYFISNNFIYELIL